MRRFSLFMLGWWVCAVSSIAQTFTAQWHVTNFVSQATQVKRVTLTPLTPFADFTNAILDDSPIAGQTDTNGVVTFTNLFAGYSYRFELDTLYKKVIRTNGFPVGLTGTVAAEPYTGVWLPGQTIFAYISTNAQQVTYSGGIATSATNLLGSITSAQVSDATSAAIPNTIVKRDANSIFDGTSTSALSVPGSGISGSINGAQVTGTVPAASSVPASGISGVVAVTNGGTGARMLNMAWDVWSLGGYTLFVDTASTTVSQGNVTNVMTRMSYQTATNTGTAGGIAVVFGNQQVATVGNGAPGPTNITVKASIEYPAGTFYQLTFKGATSTNISPQTQAISDVIPISIPANAQFWIRSYVVLATANTSYGFDLTGTTEKWNGLHGGVLYGAAASDLTMSGTVADSYAWGYAPDEVLAYLPSGTISVGVYGDSIASVKSDILAPHAIQEPPIDYVMSNSCPQIYMTLNGNQVSRECTNTYTIQNITRGCNVALSELGVNDLSGGFTALSNNLMRLWMSNYNAGLQVWQTTITPYTSSTDNWTTTNNQTALYYSTQTNINTWIRSCPFPLSGVIDVDAAEEPWLNSGVWIPGNTTDGLHPQTTAGQTAWKSAFVAGFNPKTLSTLPGDKKVAFASLPSNIATNNGNNNFSTAQYITGNPITTSTSGLRILTGEQYGMDVGANEGAVTYTANTLKDFNIHAASYIDGAGTYTFGMFEAESGSGASILHIGGAKNTAGATGIQFFTGANQSSVPTQWWAIDNAGNFAAAQATAGFNSYVVQIRTNALASWPSTPAFPGACAIVNSNGYPYMLLSTNGGGGASATWTGTNKLGW